MSELVVKVDPEVQRSLGRIEGKLDALNDNLIAHTMDDSKNFEALEKQFDSIQRLTWMALGVISFLGIAIPSAIAYFK